MDVQGARQVAEAAMEAAEAAEVLARAERALLGATIPSACDGRAPAAPWERKRGQDTRWWCPGRGLSLPDGHPLCTCGKPDGQGCPEAHKGRNAGAYRVSRNAMDIAGAEVDRAQAEADRTRAALGAACGGDDILATVALGAAGAARTAGQDILAVTACVVSHLGLPIVPPAEARAPRPQAAPLPSRAARKARDRALLPEPRPAVLATVARRMAGAVAGMAERTAAAVARRAARAMDAANGFAETVGEAVTLGRHARRGAWGLI